MEDDIPPNPAATAAQVSIFLFYYVLLVVHIKKKTLEREERGVQFLIVGGVKRFEMGKQIGDLI